MFCPEQLSAILLAVAALQQTHLSMRRSRITRKQSACPHFFKKFSVHGLPQWLSSNFYEDSVTPPVNGAR
jgi:hypothetical protein